MADVNTTAGDLGWENAPSHYKGNGGLENFDVWDAYELDPYSANAFKYLARWDKKGSPVDDLKKALHYVTEIPYRVDCGHGAIYPMISIQEIIEKFGLGSNPYVADAVTYLLTWACNRRDTDYLTAAEDALRSAVASVIG